MWEIQITSSRVKRLMTTLSKYILSWKNLYSTRSTFYVSTKTYYAIQSAFITVHEKVLLFWKLLHGTSCAQWMVPRCDTAHNIYMLSHWLRLTIKILCCSYHAFKIYCVKKSLGEIFRSNKTLPYIFSVGIIKWSMILCRKYN